MRKLLYVETSPRKIRSHSSRVTKSFLDAYGKTNPEDKVDLLDLWQEQLPQFNEERIDAQHAIADGHDKTPSQEAAWADVTAVINRILDADNILISAPMWNFNAPYVLKHFIDVVTQPSFLFNVTEDHQYHGLLGGKSATVVCASGGDYSEGSGAEAYDFFKPYLSAWLNFVGITDISWISVWPTHGAPEDVAATEISAGKVAANRANSI